MALLQVQAVTDALNSSDWIFPAAECFHIAAFALSIGMIALVDLRLLGVGMRRQTAAQIVRDTEPWSIFGLAIVLLSGPVLFLSDPRMYLRNESFRFKMTMLLLAIVYNYTIRRKVALSNSPPIVAKLVGALSLVLWLSVLAGGIFIAFA